MAYKDPTDPRNRAARRKHYHANKQQYLDRNAEVRRRMKQWIKDLKTVPCMDCGVTYPYYVMDFDHRDPSKKADTINRILNNGSWRKLREEVAKCDVVCANCHRERTHKHLAGEAEVAGQIPNLSPTGFDS